MDCDDEYDSLAEVVVDAPAQFYCSHKGSKIIIQQDNRCSLTRHVGAAAAHGNADVRRFERRRIVDAVAGHRDDLSPVLQEIDNPKLLVRSNPRKNIYRREALPK